MIKQTLLAAGALAFLCVIAGFPSRAGSAGQEGRDGMVVVRDPQTGKLRAPTPAEAKALRANAPSAAAATPRQPTVLPRQGNARGVRLGEKTMVYEVVARDADGGLSGQCVRGDGAAREALAHPAKPEHKEPAHEAR